MSRGKFQPLKSLVYRIYNRLFKDKTEATIFFAVFLVEIAFGFYLIYKWGFTFSCFDDVLHLYKARVVVNNGAQSGFGNLGTVWLPLFQLTLLPLVLIEPLYQTGFAGTIVNSLATGGICVTLYKMFKDRGAKIVVIALFLCNGFTLVYGSVPMNQQLALLFLVLGAYYFKEYLERDNLTEFIKCSLALILGTLTRYEIWPATLLAVLFFTVRELKNGKRYRLAYVHLPLWGIFAWLFWNLAIFRDPLMFINHPMGTRAQASVIPMPHAGSVYLTASLILKRLFSISGFLCVVSIISFGLLFFMKGYSECVSGIILMAPIGFHTLLTYTHISPAFTRYFHLGYAGLIVLPLYVLETYFHKRHKNHYVIAGLFLFLTLSFAYPTQISTINTGIFDSPDASDGWFMDVVWIKNEILELNNVIEESKIFCPFPSAASAQLSVFAGVSPSRVFDPYDDPTYAKTSIYPWDFYDYVIIKKIGNELVAGFNDYYKSIYGTQYYEYLYHNDLEWKLTFLNHYNIVLETNRYLVFKLVV